MNWHSNHIISEIPSDENETLFVLIGAMHGNEVGGINAIKKVAEVLEKKKEQIRCHFLSLEGNKLALKHKRRYIDADLNRLWTKEHLESAYSQADNYEEYKHLHDLHNTINLRLDRNFKRKVLIDLHTTSAQGGVFIVCEETEENKNWTLNLQVPTVFDLSNNLEGTAIHHYHEKGFQSMAFEGGNHNNPESVNRMESAIWLSLKHFGCLKKGFESIYSFHRKRLVEATAGLPAHCRLKYRHGLEPFDDFEMLDGFENFSKIEKGQILGRDKNGNIKAPYSGLLLMPLYQKQGTDGFFIIEEL